MGVGLYSIRNWLFGVPLPSRLARIIPLEFDLNQPTVMLAHSSQLITMVLGEADVYFSTNSPQSLAQRAGRFTSNGELQAGPFKVICFNAPEGIELRQIIGGWPGYVPGGLTKGNAREYAIPNFRISDLKQVTIREVR